jgi:Transposase DNA-binding
MGLVLRGRAPGRDQRSAFDAKTWVEREVAGCKFKDARLNKRFRTLLEQIGSDIGPSISLVCQDWANTKAGLEDSQASRGNPGACRGLGELWSLLRLRGVTPTYRSAARPIDRPEPPETLATKLRRAHRH